MGSSDLDRTAAIGEPTVGTQGIHAGVNGYWRSGFAIGCASRNGWAIRSTEGGTFQVVHHSDMVVHPGSSTSAAERLMQAMMKVGF